MENINILENNMKLIKVGAASLNQTPLDWSGNFKNIVSAINEAKKDGIKVLCLPELAITGYGLDDAFHALYIYDNVIRALFEIAKHTKGMVVGVGMPIMFNGFAYNSVCLLVDGNIGGFVCKQFMANDGVYYEDRWFRPWPKGVEEEISIKGERYPIGDIYFRIFNILIGFEICEDAWVPNRPGADLCKHGVDIIMNPSASHFAFGKQDERRRLVVDSSRAFKSAYIYANLCGNEAGRAIYSGDQIISSCGKELGYGRLFFYKDFNITSAVIDLNANRTAKVRTTSLEPATRKPVSIKCKDSLLIEETINTHAPRIITPLSKEDEFGKAVSLGLFDYLRKTYSKGFVVSLSGGADSAACACLVWLMVKTAIKELGLAGLTDKLKHIDVQFDNERAVVNELLTCVYQGTKNSSDTTLKAAEQLSTFIGAKFYNFNVQSLVEEYTDIVSQAIGREINWKQDDITLQNIQARVRSPGAWMLANIESSILLATSNRSEAAVGYATCDGDTSGGLSPLAGIDKNFLRQWLRYMEKYILALELVNNQDPTAELRPLDQTQTDEKDLMPYDILNEIEGLFVRDKKSPLEIYQLLSAKNTYTSQQYGEWISKFFTLWARNQWKRERYAPSFHLDDESLDPKTWCRFPILSGGFKSELHEMWDYINKNK